MRAAKSSSMWLNLALIVPALWWGGCARVAGGGPAKDPIGSGGSGTAGAAGGAGAGSPPGISGSGGAGGEAHPTPVDAGADAEALPPLTDFPVDPIIDPSTGSNAPALFDGYAPRTGGAPCIISPAAGTLMPRNWLRPRFDLAPAGNENLFEIELAVAGFAHPLRIFTANTSTALDLTLWNRLRASVTDRPITVTARALSTSGGGNVRLAPSAAATSTFVIAPVDAPGKIVYWALGDDRGAKVGSLKGFGIGEEGVQSVLVPSQVSTRANADTCVGCHAATPDGNGVGFSMGPTNYFNSVVEVRSGLTGNLPTYLTPMGLATIQSLRGIPSYSKAHWSNGDRVVLLSDTGALHWVQVDGAANGILARTGDAKKATEPTFSHDGRNIVYVSATSLTDGRLDTGPSDLVTIPYANRVGGVAVPLPGGSDPNATEFYPAFSPDDALIAFTRVAGDGSAYSNPAAEVYVVPFNGGAGGTAVRLAANDAASCQTGLPSPGLTNDWPKWSPRVVTAANGKTYYWLTFSSKRIGSANAQLYVTALVRDGSGVLTTTPALYLWNQPATDGNHTPSWDDFAIPPIVID